jgi:hypothetical protein
MLESLIILLWLCRCVGSIHLEDSNAMDLQEFTSLLELLNMVSSMQNADGSPQCLREVQPELHEEALDNTPMEADLSIESVKAMAAAGAYLTDRVR